MSKHALLYNPESDKYVFDFISGEEVDGYEIISILPGTLSRLIEEKTTPRPGLDRQQVYELLSGKIEETYEILQREMNDLLSLSFDLSKKIKS